MVRRTGRNTQRDDEESLTVVRSRACDAGGPNISTFSKGEGRVQSLGSRSQEPLAARTRKSAKLKKG
jgi:hypothetical protein